MSEELFNSASCSGDCTSCGSDCQDLDQPTVTLTLDDDTEVKCAVLTIFPAPNQKEYIALLPLDENGENEDGEVYLYRYYEENGQPNLDNIDSDEEYEIAAEAFDELMDTEQFNEMEENATEEEEAQTLKRLQNPAGDLIFLPGFSLFFSQIPIISYLYSFSASLFKICFYSFTDV